MFSKTDVTDVSATITTVTYACSDCVTVSGVVVGTTVPTDLIPTNETASYFDIGASDTGVNNKRALLTDMPRATLMTRAPQPIPLVDPDQNEPKAQEKFMLQIKDSIKDFDDILQISPSPDQLANWRIPLQIDGQTVQTPIGITGFWYPWSAEAKNYKMVGMGGCTGVIIVVSHPFLQKASC
jgi:hypothetical protein